MPARRRTGWSPPGLVAWRQHRRGRAVAHWLAVVLPLAAAVGLAGRSTGDAAGATATGVAGLLGLAFLGWMWGGADAAAIEDPGAPRSRALARFYANGAAVAALVAIVLLGFARLGLVPPGAGHWLGTDEIGRDVLARLLHGARVSLAVGAAVVALAVSIGTGVGLTAGYLGGLVDGSLMRLVDLLLAFPRLFLALLVIALWGPSIWLVVVVLGCTGWMSTARLVRTQVLSLRRQDFVLAAQAAGLPLWRILGRHVLPHAAAPVLVAATLMVGNTILAESVLSFLGLGVQVPAPSWGSMLNEARGSWRAAWWLATFPGLCITLTVVAHNLVGDGLRDALDPRLDLASGREREA
jgi:peptide/nickel transport system permease protein